MKQQSETYIRIPFWLDNDTSPIFCCLHLPKEKGFYSSGVVICNPLGFEYTHSHRTIRHLADQLATAGFPTIRFDYHGTGDSDSDLLAPKRLQKIMENIDSVVAKLKQVTDVKEVCLIGIRLGATFAAKYASEKNISNLVLWSPCTKGRSYVREMQALAKLASHATDNKNDFIDSGGFILTDETAAELSKLNLLKLPFTNTNNILLIERNDMQGDQKLIDSLLSNGVKDVQHYLMSGYADMMAEPQETVIPIETIDAIVKWVGKYSVQKEYSLLANSERFELTAKISNTYCSETILQIGKNELIGILTLPKKPIADTPLIILANSGSVHRVGPNRVYVELARGLASIGYSTIRFDLRNLGDSVIDFPEDENLPYPHLSTEDISDVVKHIKNIQDFDKFIFAGLCSGAHNIFHAALELESNSEISEIVMINPLAFYRRPQLTIDNSLEQQQMKNAAQYKQSFFQLEKWKKLFSGKVDLLYIFQFVWRSITRVVTRPFGLKESQLAIDFQRLSHRNIKITFIIASKDPGERLIMNQAKKTTLKFIKSGDITIHRVPDSDHTFSAMNCRAALFEIFEKHLTQRYSKV